MDLDDFNEWMNEEDYLLSEEEEVSLCDIQFVLASFCIGKTKANILSGIWHSQYAIHLFLPEW